MKFEKEPQINIHELSVDEPETKRELPFIAERDITAEEWDQMENITELNRDHPPQFFALAVYLKRLGRKIKINADDINRAIEYMQAIKATQDTLPKEYINLAADLKELGYDPQMPRDATDEIREKLRKTKDLNGYTPCAFVANCVRLGLKLPNHLAAQKETAQDLDKYREKFEHGMLVSYAANAKIAGFEPKLEPQDWEWFDSRIEESRKDKDFDNLAYIFGHLSILCGDKESSKDETPDLPENKNF